MSFIPLKLVLLFLVFISAHGVFAQAKLSSHSRALMGTKFTILLQEGPNNDSIAEIAFKEIERLNRIFSTYDSNSEVSILNHSRKWQEMSPEMLELLKFSEQLNKHSEGAFDIKIGIIINYWKEAIRLEQLPDFSKIEQEQKHKRRIRICGKKVKTNKNTILDFGGIAKGYAVDKAFLKLKKMGIDTMLIDGGGDIRMGEAPSGREGWKIMISNEPGKILQLKNCAIATSGYEYQHMLIGDVIYSHIINPRTLQSVKIKRGVSVIANDCKTADAMATSFSVMPELPKTKRYYNYKVRIIEDEEFIIKQF